MKKTLIAIAVGHALAMTANANETTTYHVELDALEAVVTNPFSQQMGTQKLTADDIARRPMMAKLCIMMSCQQMILMPN